MQKYGDGKVKSTLKRRWKVLENVKREKNEPSIGTQAIHFTEGRVFSHSKGCLSTWSRWGYMTWAASQHQVSLWHWCLSQVVWIAIQVTTHSLTHHDAWGIIKHGHCEAVFSYISACQSVLCASALVLVQVIGWHVLRRAPFHHAIDVDGNGVIHPVWKHGPRSLTCMRV